jgi:hypothetical protein
VAEVGDVAGEVCEQLAQFGAELRVRPQQVGAVLERERAVGGGREHLGQQHAQQPPVGFGERRRVGSDVAFQPLRPPRDALHVVDVMQATGGAATAEQCAEATARVMYSRSRVAFAVPHGISAIHHQRNSRRCCSLIVVRLRLSRL